MKQIRTFFRKLFCRHQWKTARHERFDVMRRDGTKEGEVTMTVYECPKCGHERIEPSDRTHIKSP